MKIGLFTDGLPDLSFTAALDWVVEQGIEAVEIATGGFSKASHCDADLLLADAGARSEFKAAVDSRGLVVSALNCNGNPVDPHPERGKKHGQDLFKCIELAHKLELDTVVAMSGCPGDPSGTPYPNWVAHSFQQDFLDLLKWQWDEVLTPFWEKAGQYASDHGVRVAIEMHPGQSVFSTPGLLRLREIAGPSVGANLDPSHLFYQGMEPSWVVQNLGPDFVFHVHAKDTRIDRHKMALSGGIDLTPHAPGSGEVLGISDPGVRPRRAVVAGISQHLASGGIRRGAEHRARGFLDERAGGHRQERRVPQASPPEDHARGKSALAIDGMP